MANRVQGRNVIVTMEVDSVYYPVFCAKTALLSQVQETIEITSVDSGNDRQYEPGMSTTTLEIGGLTILDNTENRISVLYLMQLAQRRARQTMKITLTDNDGDQIEVGFKAIITANSFDKSLGGAFSQSSTSLLVTGGITIGPSITPPNPSEVQEPLYLEAVEGETSVSDPLLTAAGVEILHVHREDAGSGQQVTGTPASGTRQFRFTAGTGTIDFDPDNPFNGGEIIYILYQKPI